MLKYEASNLWQLYLSQALNCRGKSSETMIRVFLAVAMLSATVKAACDNAEDWNPEASEFKACNANDAEPGTICVAICRKNFDTRKDPVQYECQIVNGINTWVPIGQALDCGTRFETLAVTGTISANYAFPC